MQASTFVKYDDITILYTNDIHTYIDGDIRYSTLAAYKGTFEDVLSLSPYNRLSVLRIWQLPTSSRKLRNTSRLSV